jgi:hypothetical protein
MADFAISNSTPLRTRGLARNVRYTGGGLSTRLLRAGTAPSGNYTGVATGEVAPAYDIELIDEGIYVGERCEMGAIGLSGSRRGVRHEIAPEFDPSVPCLTRWQRRAQLPFSQAMNAVAWSPGQSLFVAVGSGTAIPTSADGRSWVTREAPAAQDWRAVAWSAQRARWVAVSSDGAGDRIMHSSDGITWALQSAAAEVSSSTWRSIAWSPELLLFVAIADSGGSQIMTSPDGLEWTTRLQPASDGWVSVVWAGELGRFVAARNTGHPDMVMTSEDGFEWTLRTVPPEADLTWNSVAWSPDIQLLVAVGDDGIMRSADGEDWSVSTSPAANTWSSIAWAQEASTFIAVASGAADIYTMQSPDGIIWSTRVQGNLALQWSSVVWAEELGRAVAVSLSLSDEVMTSDRDPLTFSNPKTVTNRWFTRLANGTATGHGIAWIPEIRRLVMVGLTNNPRVNVSDDGGNFWEARNAAVTNNWIDVIWLPERQRLVATSITGTNDRVMISDDYGDTWQVRTPAADESWLSMAWIAERQRLVAVANTGASSRVMYSDDYGDTWTSVTSPVQNYTKVVWMPEVNRLFAIANSTGGGDERAMVSDDYGITWQSRSVIQTGNSVVWIPEALRLISCTTGIAFAISTDYGESWFTRSLNPSTDVGWITLAWAPEISRVVAASFNAATGRFLASSDDYGETWVTMTSNGAFTSQNMTWAREIGTFICVANTTNATRVLAQAYARIEVPSALRFKVLNKRVLSLSQDGIEIRGTVSPFTGAHAVAVMTGRRPKGSLDGLIAVSTGTIPSVQLSDAVPHVRLSSTVAERAVYGVVREISRDSVVVNAVGEGCVWVSDSNGVLQNGDYIVTSTLPGYGMRQEEPIQGSSTVAKVLCDVDFKNAAEREDDGRGISRDPYLGVTAESCYPMRYLRLQTAAGVSAVHTVSWEEYSARKAAHLGGAFRAALVPCTYHCG